MADRSVNIDQGTIDAYKRQYPNDPQIQGLTLDAVRKNAPGRINWDAINLNEPTTPDSTNDQVAACHEAVANVVIDAVLWAIGAVPLRGKIKAATVRKVARAIEPMQSKLQIIIAKMAAAQGAKKDEVMIAGALEILEEVKPAVGRIWDAFTSNLSWWDRVLYGLAATAGVAAFVLLEPYALIAEIGIHASTLGLLVSGCAKAVEICRSSHHHRSAH
jgi:hypothetical protein